MTVSGIFVYTKIDATTAALGTGSGDGNGFVDKTEVKGVVVVPSVLDNLRIVNIKTYATRQRHKITKLVLPNTLTSIEHASITWMDGLKEVVFPASLITILSNNDYFHNAEIIRFEKGSRITSIGANFLQQSYAVKEFIFPSSVQSIGANFALNCNNLEHVSFCGTTDFSSISAAFTNCPKFINVYVTYEYEGTSFGGKEIVKKGFNSCFPLKDTCRSRKFSNCRRSTTFLFFALLISS